MTPATKTLSLLALGAAALAAGSLTAPTHASAAESKTNRNGQVTVTGNGSYTLGNPAAPVKVTEYISYTCSHCAALHRESDPVLRTTAIPQGKVALTVSNLVRNPVDITIALLTSCGDPKTFFVRHNAFLASQDTWLPKAASASEAQRTRWAEGELPQRLRAIASDLDFYKKVEHFGITRSKADQCLADKAQLDKVMAQYEAASQLKLTGTPGIVINGKVLYATKDGKVLQSPMGGPLQATQWKDLSAAITKALAANTAGQI
ncbi:DsbA family protein [Novosphingobium decolorationis]|uniref:Thioredoxin domain-containing protein n=1 Tax=Novosphingobium decolorationis TaxID=2698673 RepID=A0ABX8E4Y2_9SPHN|nr:thioredoxin domain-containing protein [Novosphingobium decolorationis]MED5546309.1 thioredoxin domain-containing protein [Pseudomonadota bacterium]QVM84240.1 thioredoxin domain-containing protein [Novosphingobium decolorationis]